MLDIIPLFTIMSMLGTCPVLDMLKAEIWPILVQTYNILRFLTTGSLSMHAILLPVIYCDHIHF